MVSIDEKEPQDLFNNKTLLNTLRPSADRINVRASLELPNWIIGSLENAAANTESVLFHNSSEDSVSWLNQTPVALLDTRRTEGTLETFTQAISEANGRGDVKFSFPTNRFRPLKNRLNRAEIKFSYHTAVPDYPLWFNRSDLPTALTDPKHDLVMLETEMVYTYDALLIARQRRINKGLKDFSDPEMDAMSEVLQKPNLSGEQSEQQGSLFRQIAHVYQEAGLIIGSPYYRHPFALSLFAYAGVEYDTKHSVWAKTQLSFLSQAYMQAAFAIDRNVQLVGGGCDGIVHSDAFIEELHKRHTGQKLPDNIGRFIPFFYLRLGAGNPKLLQISERQLANIVSHTIAHTELGLVERLYTELMGLKSRRSITNPD